MRELLPHSLTLPLPMVTALTVGYSFFLSSAFAQTGNPLPPEPKEDDPAIQIPEETAEENAAHIMFREASAQIAKDVTNTLDNLSLSKERRKKLTMMTVAAYQMNSNLPLWDTLLDQPQPSDEQLLELLEFNGLSAALQIPPISEVKPETYLHVNSPVATDDLLVTLRLAETCLLLKEGPDNLNLGWGENWLLDDFSGEGDVVNHVRRMSYQFAMTVASKPDSRIAIALAYVPRNWVYRRLMEEYIKIEEGNPPPKLYVSKFIKAGDEFQQSKELAIYLHEEGHLTDSELGSSLSVGDGIFSRSLSNGLKSYQRAKGLDVDGILGPATADRLSQGNEIDRNKILLNLHRARFLPNIPGKKYIMVNLPSAAMYAMEENQVTSDMRIVFGQNKEGHRTPIFRDEIEFVVFHPNSGTESSEASSLRRKYLNPLSREFDEDEKGKVSFLFPNDHSVFLHDFGSSKSFSESNRALSKGAMQLQEPEKMARWVLKDHVGWNAYAVERAIKSGGNQWVKLKEPVSVYIVYFTAFPKTDNDTGINFHFDYYRRDQLGQKTL